MATDVGSAEHAQPHGDEKQQEAAILLQGVTFTYAGRPLILDLNETIGLGEHVAIVGESGCGKSTLLGSLVGLTKPEAGQLVVLGRAVNEENIGWIRSHVAWMPQRVEYPYTRVREMLQAPYRWKVNRRRKPDWEAIAYAAKALGLTPEILGAHLSELSGGERQRVEIIATMQLGRPIVLMDEPTSALDPASTNLLVDYLHGFHRSTLVAISHNQHFAESMDRTIRIAKL